MRASLRDTANGEQWARTDRPTYELLHGEGAEAFRDAGYQGAHKRVDAQQGMTWHVAMLPGKRKLLDPTHPIDALTERIEKLKASIRAKVEHPFPVIKRQFDHIKVSSRRLAKNTAQLVTLLALSNVWMARGKLSRVQG